MRQRLVVVSVVVLALLGLSVLSRGSTAVVTGGAPATADPMIPGDGASASSWFCAAASAGTSQHPSHEIVITNPTGRAVTASLTSFLQQGDPPAPTIAQVPARSTTVVPAPVADASVMVELSAAGPEVSHRVATESLVDEQPCATAASADWYFPAADTASQGDAAAQLWLSNPFLSDASIDVTVSSDDGVRVPTELSGLVIPGRSTKVVDLGKIVQRRDQFSMAVHDRSGRVVAELSQSMGTPAGIRLTLGVSRTATRLAFADGISGPGLPERYQIFDPTSVDAQVLVAVIPLDAAPGLLPEPFQVDVPARKSVSLDLDQQSRIPEGTPHWVRIESVGGVGIAVQRLVAIGSGNPLGLKSGLAGSTGSPVSATRWVVPWADRSASSQTKLVVANPSTDTIAVVTIRPYAGGSFATGDAVRKLELKPGTAAVVDLGADGAQPGGILVGSASPVVVERRVTAGSNADLSVMGAVPVAGTTRSLPPLSDSVADASGSGGSGSGGSDVTTSVPSSNTSSTTTTG